VLDRVREVYVGALDPGPLKRSVEHASRRPDERSPFDVLAVPRLLADHHHT
jgi:hypothetical protein